MFLKIRDTLINLELVSSIIIQEKSIAFNLPGGETLLTLANPALGNLSTGELEKIKSFLCVQYLSVVDPLRGRRGG